MAQWLALVCLVSAMEGATELCAVPGDGKASRGAPKHPRYCADSCSEPSSKEMMRKRANPCSGLLAGHLRSRGQSVPLWTSSESRTKLLFFLLKHNLERCFSLLSLSRL